MTDDRPDDRQFGAIVDGYQLTLEGVGVRLTIDRLRRERHELVGELAVACFLSGARTVDNHLSVATLNISSAPARASRAKLLAERSEAFDLDWHGYLEELCVRTIAAERQGTPARLLSTFRRPDADATDAATFNIEGWPWLPHHPMITFADGGGLKSYLALYGAGLLSQRGVRFGFADWEQEGETHLGRLAALFPEPLPSIYYVRCDRPLVDETERIIRETHRHGIDYWICDSCGFATGGPPEAAEHALAYMRAVRQIGVGSHHLAHVNRSEQADQKPFGSSFWHNSVRATWYAKRAESADRDHVIVGLYNRKSNLTKLHPSIAFEFDFSTAGVATVRRASIEDVQDLAVALPLWQRIAALLKAGGGRPLTVAEICEELGEKPNSVRKAIAPSRARKGGSMFTQVSGSDGERRIALVERRPA